MTPTLRVSLAYSAGLLSFPLLRLVAEWGYGRLLLFLADLLAEPTPPVTPDV